MAVTQVTCELGGQKIIIETGKMAKQAGGAVTVRCGDSIVLVTATASQTAKEGIDFLPLTVEYLEKTFAAGKIPGGFFKREGRPSEAAILTSRFIDRPIRPLFPENYYFDTQVITTVLSAAPENNPDTLAIIGASAALCVSDIPFAKPIAGCRVGRINGEFKLNPGLYEMDDSDMELIVAATNGAVVMVEGNCAELPEDVLLQAIQFAHDNLKPIIAAQLELQAKAGKAKRVITAPVKDENITKMVREFASATKAALALPVKQERYAQLAAIKDEIKKKLFPEGTAATVAQSLQLAGEYESLKSDLMRAAILDEKKRIDGRGFTDIRNISCETNLLPRAHGFCRAQGLQSL